MVCEMKGRPEISGGLLFSGDVRQGEFVVRPELLEGSGCAACFGVCRLSLALTLSLLAGKGSCLCSV